MHFLSESGQLAQRQVSPITVKGSRNQFRTTRPDSRQLAPIIETTRYHIFLLVNWKGKNYYQKNILYMKI